MALIPLNAPNVSQYNSVFFTCTACNYITCSLQMFYSKVINAVLIIGIGFYILEKLYLNRNIVVYHEIVRETTHVY